MPKHTIRQIANAPFCWQEKAVLRKIRESFDAENAVSSTLAVYVALCEIASDEQAESFHTTHAWLAHMSGLSVRTVQARLRGLIEIGVLAVETQALRAPSRYHLLPFGNGCASIRNGCRAFGNGQKQASLPTSEESKEESKNHIGGWIPPTEDECKEAARARGLDSSEGERFHAYYTRSSWAQIREAENPDWRYLMKTWSPERNPTRPKQRTIGAISFEKKVLEDQIETLRNDTELNTRTGLLEQRPGSKDKIRLIKRKIKELNEEIQAACEQPVHT